MDWWLRFAQATPAVLCDVVSKAMHTSAMKAPPLRVGEEWRNDLELWLGDQRLTGRPLVLLQAGNRRTTKWGRPRKRPSNTKYWPEERWALVVDALAHAEPEAEILLTGVPHESRLNEAILNLARTDRARNVAHDLPLCRLLALQERAIGMISV